MRTPDHVANRFPFETYEAMMEFDHVRWGRWSQAFALTQAAMRRRFVEDPDNRLAQMYSKRTRLRLAKEQILALGRVRIAIDYARRLP